TGGIVYRPGAAALTRKTLVEARVSRPFDQAKFWESATRTALSPGTDGSVNSGRFTPLASAMIVTCASSPIATRVLSSEASIVSPGAASADDAIRARAAA